MGPALRSATNPFFSSAPATLTSAPDQAGFGKVPCVEFATHSCISTGVLTKFDMTTRVHLVIYAYERGLVAPSPTPDAER